MLEAASHAWQVAKESARDVVKAGKAEHSQLKNQGPTSFKVRKNTTSGLRGLFSSRKGRGVFGFELIW